MWPLAKLVTCAILLSVALVAPWRWLPPPTTAFMLRERFSPGSSWVQHRWVPRHAISRNLALCVIAAEDQKFFRHHGFDLESIQRSALEARARPRGASTISQQVAKNLFLWPGRSFVRKGIEAYFTVLIEQLWPKRRILEVYLNIAEFGPGLFGAAVASERTYGKPARELTMDEAALLAAVLPNPKRMSAAAPSEYVRERATEIQSAARELDERGLAGL